MRRSFQLSTAAFLLLGQPASALVGRLFKGKASNPIIEDTPAATKLPPKILDNRGLDYIFDKNDAWKESKLESDKKFFKALGSRTSTPEYMYIGCVDSTVPENLMMGEAAENIFVHRNVANLVVETDMNLLSALQYGVNQCNVQDIIVCGHYECGGVRAALAATKDAGAPLQTWLANVRQVYTRHEKELDAIEDPSDRYRRFVELNVIEQCINVFKFSVVQSRREESFLEGEMVPRVHAMIFDPSSGDLKRIPFDFSEYSEGK